MDCYFAGYCQESSRQAEAARVEQMLRSCAVEPPRHYHAPCPPPCVRPCIPCPPPCPPANDHLRHAAGVPSGRDANPATCYEDPCGPTRWCVDPADTRTCMSQAHAMSHARTEKSAQPLFPCTPKQCSNDGLRFSRYAMADRLNADCRPAAREPSRSVQVGFQPMQFVQVQDFDPCPNKKGADCDCFNPDGTWKDNSKPKPIKRVPLNMRVGLSQAADFDPCPNKKGADCDCFNPDGTWKDKSKKAPKSEPYAKTGLRCEDNCPACPIEIHSRTVYPKCEPMLPGYGGHVPGLNVCKFGKTFGRETREALQKVYSTPVLSRRKC